MTKQQTTSNGKGDFLQAAQQYRERGFAVVPTQGKDAFVYGWQRKGTPPGDDTKYWSNGHAYNIGLVLGVASGGLVDIDRDCDLPERVENMFLPNTLMSGRETRPYTHSWYYCRDFESRALYDATGKKFLEVRADGHQTVVAPSTHPEGDRYVWHRDTGPVATVDAETLERAINEYATALLLAIHMPPVGSRHEYALAAAGYLLRNGRFEPSTVYSILLGAWHARRADERKAVKELEAAALDTAEKLEAGEEVKGGGALSELVEGLPKRIAKVWKWTRTESTAPSQPPADPATVGMTKLLADAITATEHFAQDAGGKLYRFSDGTYKQFGERFIKRQVKELVEEWDETKRWSAHRANEVAAYIQADTPELWATPPLDEVNLANGILNVWTRQLRDHDPAFLSTVQIPVTYDPEAECPAWDKFIATTFPEDAQALAYEVAADLMTPERSEQKSILLIGEGSNGKSTYLTAASSFVGSTNIVGLSLHKMESDRFSSSRLLGKLANICPDLPSSHLTGTSMFKAVTGGDAINAEYKYRESFEFRPFARLVFSANQVPRSEDATHAFFRRWLVVPFERTFEEAELIPRQELDGKLSDPKELSGVLNRALDVLPSLRRNGFTESAKMKEAWEEFRAMTDPVSVWLDKYTVEHPDAYAPRDDFWQKYNDHTEHAKLTKKAFGQALKRARPRLGERQVSIGGRRTWCWIGIALQSSEKAPPYQGPGTYYRHAAAQGAQHSTNCYSNDGGTDNTEAEEETQTQTTSREKPVHPVQQRGDTVGECSARSYASWQRSAQGLPKRQRGQAEVAGASKKRRELLRRPTVRWVGRVASASSGGIRQAHF
jgi:P4 family phage/plasmid primase-like protien